MLTIRLFGAPQILHNGQPVSINRRKSRALIFYLASQPHPTTRETLLAVFWPEVERAAAQQTLRSLLHGIRQAVGPALVVSGDEVSIQADVDVRSFQEVADRPVGRPITDPEVLASALDLYRGDFLEGFSLPDSDEFNSWATRQQEQYRRTAVRGYEVLSQIAIERHDFPSAQDAIERALRLDPLQEDLQRDLLRLLYEAGDRTGAVRQYDTFRKQLDEELGVPPMPETRALYDSILADTVQPADQPRVAPVPFQPAALPSPSSPPVDPGIPFIGRASELEQISAAIAAGQLVLLEGEPGIGKTRLVEEYTRQHQNLVLASTARELEQVLPYQPWRSAIRGLLNRADWPALRARIQLPPLWGAEVSRLLPEFNGGQPGADALVDEARLWEGLYRFLQALSNQTPVFVFLDDIHWADSASLGLLGYMLRQRAGESGRLAFVAATHPVSPGSPLGNLTAALARENRIVRIAPTRLTSADILAIAEAVSPGEARPLAEWLERNSEGNAYFLVELLRLARSSGILSENGRLNQSLLSASPTVPQSVYSLIETRLARLSEPARQLMDTGVAAGREFEVAVVLEASSLPEAEGLKALEELETAGIIHSSSSDGRYSAFDHSLVMEVAYREAGEARHRRYHYRIAEALEKIYRDQLDSVAGILASHFEEGNAPLKAAPYARRAAVLALNLAATDQAVHFYQQALRDDIDARKCIPTWIALGNVYTQIGDTAQAIEAFQNAIDLAYEIGDPKLQSQSKIALANSYLLVSRFSEAIDLAQQVLRAGDEESALDAEFVWGTALSLAGADLEGASQHLATAAKMCQVEQQPEKRMRIEFEQGSVAAQRGDLQHAVELYRMSLQTSLSISTGDSLLRRVLAYNNLAYHLHLLGDVQGESYAQVGLKLAQEKGILSLQPYLYSTLGEIYLDRGDLDQAESFFQHGLELSKKIGVREREAGITANLGRLAERRGDPAAAVQLLTGAKQQSDAIGARHLGVQIRVWLARLVPPADAALLLFEARKSAPVGSTLLQKEIAQAEEKIRTASG